MSWILLGLGLVCVLEGLAIALAPARLDELLRQLAEIPAETRRFLGLAAMACGVILIWLARALGI